MPRVLHVLNELRRSGAEVMLAAAAAHFSAAGYETHVLSTGAVAGDCAARLAEAGCVVHHLPFAKSPAFFSRFRRLVVETLADVVHVHCERAAVFYALAVPAPVRVARTVHAIFEFDGVLRRRKAAERWASRLLGVSHIAPSPSVRQNERRRFANETRLCPNWYDESRFFPPDDERRRAARAALGFCSDDVVLVSVGAHEPVKNLECALRAVAGARAVAPVRLLHVGRETDPVGGASLSETAAALGIASIVRCVGQTDDVAGRLHAADLHLMPSLREGMGVAAVEAMATGLPQILADVPGLADFKGLAPGIVHVAPTAEAMTQAVVTAASTPAVERRRIGAEIAAAARARFSTEAGARRYVDAYADLLGRGVRT